VSKIVLQKIVLVTASLASIVYLLLVSYFLIDKWWVELLSFFMPFVLCANFLLFVFSLWLKVNWKYVVFTSVALFLSIKPIQETIGLNFRKDYAYSDVRVVSFNAAAFNPYRGTDFKSNHALNADFYNWIRKNSPDVLCIQEFYHSDFDEYDQTLDSIVNAGNYKYYYINPVYKEEQNGIMGVITFSKYKALQSGELIYSKSPINKGTWHDFVIKDDTVRFFNFQLRSMNIRVQSVDTLGLFSSLCFNIKDVYDKLKFGYHSRRDELKKLEEIILSSPYKTIVCADINALPYSITYQKINSDFHNSFEKGGTGLGFTYHHFPWFIRIDNQFFDKRIRIDYFKTHTNFKVSDHHPIEAGYSFP
jgi:endonuclease/exonuclease/phosphatase family metal-dependent hydrolase